MNKLLPPTFVFSILLLSGCAQQRGYIPAVDTRASDPNATANLERDLQECEALAQQAAGNTGSETVIGAGIGGVIGAATGAVAGAIGGNPAIGAAVGAATGGLGGAITQGFQSDAGYKRAFNNCMIGRGHRVIE